MNTQNSRGSYIRFIASLLIVGTIGVFRRYIPISSPLLAFFRGLIGSVSLLVFVLLTGRFSRQKTGARKLAAMVLNGALIGINWILLFEAFNNTTIAKATLAYYMQPTIVLLLSPLVFREKLTGRKLICAAVSLAGMVLVSGVIGARGAGVHDARGILLGLGAACFYSMVIIMSKKITGVDPWSRTIIQLFSAAVVLVPYLLINHDFSAAAFTPGTAALVLVVGIIHTGIAYALYFSGMDGLKAQTVSALSYTDPVTAMIVSALVLREQLSVPGIIGAVLIIGSAVISEYGSGKTR